MFVLNMIGKVSISLVAIWAQSRAIWKFTWNARFSKGIINIQQSV